MREHTGRRLRLVAVLVLAVVAGACSSSGADRNSATTKASHTRAASGAPVPSAGCSLPAAVSETQLRQNVTVDGTQRWYLLTTPPTHKGAPLPVVVDLHGLSEGATLEAITTQFSPKALSDGFIVVFPQGTGNPVGWNIQPGTSTHPNRDIAFMNAMLNQLEAQLCVDTSRVYATGLSDGALFTSLLACTMTNRFAAFAPVAGVVVPVPCHPGRPVPILAFHGTADPTLPFNGGTPGTTPPPINLHGTGYPANVQAWAVKDGCDPSSTDTQVTAHVILRTYRCPPGAAVEFYIVVGGGHAWPGSQFSAINGPSTFEINATDLIWNFFRRHHLSGT
jgi:polyhydroxybutyrate depolymerase